MSLCFCSILKPSLLILNGDHGFVSRLASNTSTVIKPARFCNLRAHGESSCIVEAYNDGTTVILPDIAMSGQTATLDDHPEAESRSIINEAASSTIEEYQGCKAEIRSKKSQPKGGNVEDIDEESMFKLRNGREVLEEKAYLVGVARKGYTDGAFAIEESLSELEQLADTAGLLVVGSTYQKLATPNPRTYIGSGKVAEIKSAIHAFDVQTVIFDDELSPGQLRNLEKIFDGDVRVCDRTALILDIFNQRAATREASLQ